jgi:hypothetical protein
MYLAFCYNVKPRMMNTIVFTKKPNKQKNIEKCSHILHTHTTVYGYDTSSIDAPSIYYLRGCYGVLPEVIVCAYATGSCITG